MSHNYKSIEEVLEYITKQEDGDIRTARSMMFYTKLHNNLGNVVDEAWSDLSETSHEVSTFDGIELPAGTYEVYAVLKLRRTGDAPIETVATGGYQN